MKNLNNSIPIKFDSLGRLTIPIQYRRALGMEVHETVQISITDNKLVVFKSPKKDFKKKINDIKEKANNNESITSEEYTQLCTILDKLK